MKNSRKIICAVLCAMLVLGLCACSNETTDNGNAPVVLVAPDVIYGTWYPHPEVSSVPVVVNKDGTCIIDGKQQKWVVTEVEEDTTVLLVGEGEEAFEITFKYLTSDIPVLADKFSGWSLKDGQLWNYMTNWYNQETNKTFTTSLFALKEAGCILKQEAEKLTVEVPAGAYAGYKLEITAQQCVVTDAEGNATTYLPDDQYA